MATELLLMHLPLIFLDLFLRHQMEDPRATTHGWLNMWLWAFMQDLSSEVPTLRPPISTAASKPA